MSTRYENSAIATNASARMTLINTIFQVKSNKIGTYGTLKKKKKKNEPTKQQICQKLDVFGNAKICYELSSRRTKNAPEFLVRKLNSTQIL
jgi:hypothetical protein